MLAGKWTYRSYRNETDLVGDDAAKALALIFGEGVFEFVDAGGGRFTGGLGMGPGYALTLEGEAVAEGFAIRGTGIDGTATAGWRYDYRGGFGYRWPEGVDQPDTMLGTVVRVVAHGPNSPAGVTAGFIAVRQAPQARSQRAFTLTAGL